MKESAFGQTTQIGANKTEKQRRPAPAQQASFGSKPQGDCPRRPEEVEIGRKMQKFQANPNSPAGI